MEVSTVLSLTQSKQLELFKFKFFVKHGLPTPLMVDRRKNIKLKVSKMEIFLCRKRHKENMFLETIV